MNNNVKALKSGVWYTVSNFATKAMGFVTMPIFTRIMSSSDVGDYSNFSAWIVILAAITSVDLYSSVAVARFDYKDELNEYIASVLVLGSSITAGCYALTIIFQEHILKFLNFSAFELHLAFIYFMVYPAIQMFQIKSRIEYKYKVSVAISLSSTIISTLVALLLVFLTQDKLSGRLLGNYVPLIIMNALVYLYILRQSRWISTKYWKYGLTISLPLVWHTLSANLLGSSDRVMIKYFCGSSATAFYSVAYSCAMAVSILWTSMNTAWSPWAYEKMNEKNYEALKKASRPYLLFFGFVVFCFILIAPEVLYIMGGEAYSTAVGVIPPVMVAYIFQFVYSLYVNIETYCKKQKYIAIGTTIAAILNIILNYIFIPIFGYQAAAYTTLIGYIVLFWVHFLFVVRLKKQNWYDTKFNILFLLFFILLMFLGLLLYQHRIIRYTIIIFIFMAFVYVIILFNREIREAITKRDITPVISKITIFFEVR